MNIFALDVNQSVAVKALHDKHIVAMTKETGQILSTVRQHYGDSPIGLPKPTHTGHPVVVWTKSSRSNYMWLVAYLKAICEEYTYRYYKIHTYYDLLYRFRETGDMTFPKEELEPFALAMPDKYKVEDPIQSYRNFYLGEKIQGKFWTNRTLSEMPEWLRPHLTPFMFKLNRGETIKYNLVLEN